jgi:hypothetical protein
VNDRRNVPIVDGANGTNPSTFRVDPGPEPVQGVDVRCPGDHAHHDRHHLDRRVRGTGVNPPATRPGGRDARQGGHQQQARIGHQVRVIEDHLDPVRIVQDVLTESAFLDLG